MHIVSYRNGASDEGRPSKLRMSEDSGPRDDAGEEKHLTPSAPEVEAVRQAHGGDFVGRSKAIRVLLRQAEVAATGADSPILITGPMGAGKSHLARFIHRRSLRADRALTFVDCGALPAIENALFGHRRGAFTGAEGRFEGLLGGADGGIVVLDDVERLDHHQQDLLHRVVVDGAFRPLGADRARQVDVRFIATTNVDLSVEVEKGRLKRDFVSRLSYFELAVPALAERREDIPDLCRSLLGRNHRRLIKKGIAEPGEIEFDESCWPAFMARGFPDNIRGLDKLIVRLLAHLQGRRQIRPSDLDAVAPVVTRSSEPWFEQPKPLRMVREAAEKKYILEVCRQTDFNLRAAARALEISPKSLYAKLKRYGITRP